MNDLTKKENKSSEQSNSVINPSDAQIGRGLEPQIQKRIGKELKSIYDEVANEPIPDDMIELLDRLAREENKS